MKKNLKNEITNYVALVSNGDQYHRGQATVAESKLWENHLIMVNEISGSNGNSLILFQKSGKLVAVGKVTGNGKSLKFCKRISKKKDSVLTGLMSRMLQVYGEHPSDFDKGVYVGLTRELHRHGFICLDMLPGKCFAFMKNDRVVMIANATTDEIRKAA